MLKQAYDKGVQDALERFKVAVNWGGLAGGARMLGQGALGLAKANPQITGALAGAGIGAMAGGEGHRLSGALTGAGAGMALSGLQRPVMDPQAMAQLQGGLGAARTGLGFGQF